MSSLETLKRRRAELLSAAVKGRFASVTAFVRVLLPDATKREQKAMSARVSRSCRGETMPPHAWLIEAATILGVEKPSSLYVELSPKEKRITQEEHVGNGNSVPCNVPNIGAVTLRYDAGSRRPVIDQAPTGVELVGDRKAGYRLRYTIEESIPVEVLLALTLE